ncbi:Gfo/Idh/MocA family oxidoreductase [Halobacteria archaeon AArc-m2/3/4]|uniref:Gfo/Idh/MocA family oxidoreductase n=1 Tax=Natronoglomus mannanivorans TaxID=2979990 RepID=A0ABT2QDG8_9EURY|nr:Gfo/Idh/MocA family oxidoreductase [Halobacteria archaeon AArc-m2/3/4]
MTAQIRFGIVGAAGRGMGYRIPATEDDRVTVRAVCDVSPDGLERAQEAFGAPECYTDFHEMLWEADLDAVLIATPKEHHVPQSVAALERGLDVLCEVPACRSLEEGRELVRAVDDSPGRFMIAENDVFRRGWMLVAELVADGRFGDVYYARSERVTNSADHVEEVAWRRTWRTGRNGVTYPTHNLGPLLRWFPDDRIDRVSCEGSGHHHVDPRGDPYEQEDTVVMLAKTERDRLIVHRQDILSERPAAGYRFELQGTRGCFESAPHADADHRISLADSDGGHGWQSLEDYEDDYLPDRWRTLPEVARETGRNGGDYLVFESFVDAIVSDSPPPIDVHEGLDMTLPGLVSERSIDADGEWLDVPDSREW